MARLATSLLLAFFENDLLVGVTHALALVGLGRPDAANLGRGLTDALPVITLDQYLGLARGLDRDALGNGIAHRMRETQREIQALADHLRAKAHADQLELALIATRDALDHVGQMRARGPRAHARLVVAHIFDGEPLVLLLDRYARAEHDRERAARAFDGHGAGRHADAHARWQIDDSIGNSGHVSVSHSVGSHQATMHSTSPPWPIAWAALSVMTPLGVETMTVPMPPSTRGNSCLRR